MVQDGVMRRSARTRGWDCGSLGFDGTVIVRGMSGVVIRFDIVCRSDLCVGESKIVLSFGFWMMLFDLRGLQISRLCLKGFAVSLCCLLEHYWRGTIQGYTT